MKRLIVRLDNGSYGDRITLTGAFAKYGAEIGCLITRQLPTMALSF